MSRYPLLAALLLAGIALSACSSTQDVLNPSAVAAAPPTTTLGQAEGNLGMTPMVETASVTGATANTKISGGRLQIDPIVGASVEAATPLSERLAEAARARGFKLASDGAGPAPTHILKGYFSAITDGPETTVIYVWDVYDPAGNRLHRINGQQQMPSNGVDGWASVSAATMQGIADRTVDQLTTWLVSATG
jgi:hypothetical protein